MQPRTLPRLEVADEKGHIGTVRPALELDGSYCALSLIVGHQDLLHSSPRQHRRRDTTPHPIYGSQFTSTDFIKVLAAREIRISMDGKGAWRDSVFGERLWRSIKYQEVYLRAYASISEARAGVGRYPSFYIGRRPHSSLDGRTPDQASFNQPTPEAVAA